MRRLVSLHGQSRPEVLARRLLAEARSIMAEDIAANKALGGHGAKLIRRRGAVITHCNAGALATAGYGTALGVIRTAWQRGSRFEVYATETDRKSTRLNSSHVVMSYAVLCLEKKNKQQRCIQLTAA